MEIRMYYLTTGLIWMAEQTLVWSVALWLIYTFNCTCIAWSSFCCFELRLWSWAHSHPLCEDLAFFSDCRQVLPSGLITAGKPALLLDQWTTNPTHLPAPLHNVLMMLPVKIVWACFVVCYRQVAVNVIEGFVYYNTIIFISRVNCGRCSSVANEQ